MSITAFQVNGGLVTPLADRKLYSFLSNDDVGILIGTSTCTAHGTYVTVSSGWGIIKGCVFRIVDEDITVELATAGDTKWVRLGIRLNLAAESQENVMEFFIDYASAPTDLRALVQQDINAGGQVYEFALKTFTVSDASIITGPSTAWNNSKIPYVVGATAHYPISPNENPSSFPRVDVVFRDGTLQAVAYDGTGSSGYSETDVNSSYHKAIDEYGTFFPRIGELRGNIDGTPSGGSLQDVEVTKSTFASLRSITVGPGRWLIFVSTRFSHSEVGDSASGVGRRQSFVTTSTPTGNVAGGTWSGAPSVVSNFGNDIVAPVSKYYTFSHLTVPYDNRTSDDKTLYIGCYQDCGSNTKMKVRAAVNLIRISDKDRWETLGDEDDNATVSNG